MALIKCPDCGKDVSDSSKNCIHCGCVLKEETVKGKKDKSASKFRITAAIIFMVVTLLTIIFHYIAPEQKYDLIKSIEHVYFDGNVPVKIQLLFIEMDGYNFLEAIYYAYSVCRYALLAFLITFFAVPKIRKRWASFVMLVLNVLAAHLMLCDMLIYMSVLTLIAWFVAMIICFISLIAKDKK